jgi:choline transport protein
MARDDVFPFSQYLRWIFEPTKIPLANVVFVFTIDSILLLLQLASTTAFNALIAIATLGFQISYLMPIFFRCTTARHTFRLGEFNLGKFSIPNAIISCTWLFITSIFMFFPSEYPVTKDNMNYAIVIIGGVALIALIYWVVSARHSFVGPKRMDMDPIPLSSRHTTVEDATTKPVPELTDTTESQL